MDKLGMLVVLFHISVPTRTKHLRERKVILLREWNVSKKEAKRLYEEFKNMNGYFDWSRAEVFWQPEREDLND